MNNNDTRYILTVQDTPAATERAYYYYTREEAGLNAAKFYAEHGCYHVTLRHNGRILAEYINR